VPEEQQDRAAAEAASYDALNDHVETADDPRPATIAGMEARKRAIRNNRLRTQVQVDAVFAIGKARLAADVAKRAAKLAAEDASRLRSAAEAAETQITVAKAEAVAKASAQVRAKVEADRLAVEAVKKAAVAKAKAEAEAKAAKERADAEAARKAKAEADEAARAAAAVEEKAKAEAEAAAVDAVME
jgi:hypothetical protein